MERQPSSETQAERERKILDAFRLKEEAERKRKSEERQKKQAALSPEERIKKDSRPTAEQRVLLEQFGVEVLPTKKLNSRQIDFILKGNGTGDESFTEAQRASLLKTVQERWKDKNVTHRFSKQKGVVLCIFPRTSQEVRRQIEDRKESGSDVPVSPFEARVMWEKEDGQGKRASSNSFYNLVLEEDQTQEGAGPVQDTILTE